MTGITVFMKFLPSLSNEFPEILAQKECDLQKFKPDLDCLSDNDCGLWLILLFIISAICYSANVAILSIFSSNS